MKAELKSIFSTTLPAVISSLPEDMADCWVDIVADIGVVGEDGSDAFTFQVCTTKRLLGAVGPGECLIEPNLIVVDEFDWAVVENSIRELVVNFEAPDWEPLARKIHCYAAWEYYDLQE